MSPATTHPRPGPPKTSVAFRFPPGLPAEPTSIRRGPSGRRNYGLWSKNAARPQAPGIEVRPASLDLRPAKRFDLEPSTIESKELWKPGVKKGANGVGRVTQTLWSMAPPTSKASKSAVTDAHDVRGAGGGDNIGDEKLS